MTRSRSDAWTRRRLGVGTIALAAFLAVGNRAPAAERRGRKKQEDRCLADGRACGRESTRCRARYCLKAPLTITASWQDNEDRDTFLFVPPRDATTGPAPYIDATCTESASRCRDRYPFACVAGDETAAGDEITIIHRLIAGRYEYWLKLPGSNNADEVTVTLRDRNGRVVREWRNPRDSTSYDDGWHVFDIDGGRGSIVSIDTLIEPGSPPGGAHRPNTEVCPNRIE